MKAALTMIQDLLPDVCGVLYRWEIIDLATWKSALSMQADDLREYVSPSIHYMKTMGTIVFGIRFGFTTKNPVEWQSKENTKESMRRHKVWATVSNLSSARDKLVHAGYILMKAPPPT